MAGMTKTEEQIMLSEFQFQVSVKFPMLFTIYYFSLKLFITC